MFLISLRVIYKQLPQTRLLFVPFVSLLPFSFGLGSNENFAVSLWLATTQGIIATSIVHCINYVFLRVPFGYQTLNLVILLFVVLNLISILSRIILGSAVPFEGSLIALMGCVLHEIFIMRVYVIPHKNDLEIKTYWSLASWVHLSSNIRFDRKIHEDLRVCLYLMYTVVVFGLTYPVLGGKCNHSPTRTSLKNNLSIHICSLSCLNNYARRTQAFSSKVVQSCKFVWYDFVSFHHSTFVYFFLIFSFEQVPVFFALRIMFEYLCDCIMSPKFGSDGLHVINFLAVFLHETCLSIMIMNMKSPAIFASLILADMIENMFCLYCLYKTNSRKNIVVVPENEVIVSYGKVRRSTRISSLVTTFNPGDIGTALFIAATLLQRELVETIVPIQASAMITVRPILSHSHVSEEKIKRLFSQI